MTKLQNLHQSGAVIPQFGATELGALLQGKLGDSFKQSFVSMVPAIRLSRYILRLEQEVMARENGYFSWWHLFSPSLSRQQCTLTTAKKFATCFKNSTECPGFEDIEYQLLTRGDLGRIIGQFPKSLQPRDEITAQQLGVDLQ